MKKLITLLAITLSIGAFAQEKIILNSSNIEVRASSAILIRTSQTPDKVEVTFLVPMANTFCAEPHSDYIRRTCHRSENVYQTRTTCRDEVITPATTNNRPTGPRYNPPRQTRRVCTNSQVFVGTRQVAYDCSYVHNWCGRFATDISYESDKVKIKFKNLPNLGGTEEDAFEVTARQRTTDGENVVYDITPLQTVAPYKVEKKGILGFDSYVIEQK